MTLKIKRKREKEKQETREIQGASERGKGEVEIKEGKKRGIRRRGEKSEEEENAD